MKEDLPPLEFTLPDDKPKSYRVVQRPGGVTQLVLLEQQKTLLEHEEILKASFPHLHFQLKSLWGTQEAHDLMARLLWGDADDRNRFPSEVTYALMSIFMEHESQFNFSPTIGSKDNIRRRDSW